MYLLITESKYKDKIYKSAKIVKSYKTPEGKSRQAVIKCLGPVRSDEDLKKFKSLVEEMKKGKEFIDLNSLEIESAKNFGVFYVVDNLFKKYGLDNILKKNLSKYKSIFYDILLALIINRLENPQSKNKAFEYIKHDYAKEINCKKDDLYFAMDALYNNKEKIELEFFQILKSKLNLNLKNSHYDITSSYFEGHKCEIATYGYSRDHRNDREQIVIGLVLVDGIPIYHEVFKGNTSDKTTVSDTVNYLRDKFNLKETTFIGDRGMLTEKNLEDLELKNQKYILGFSKQGNPITEELLQMDVPLKNNETQNAILAKTIEKKVLVEEKEYTFSRNYILCLDQNTKVEKLKTLDEVKNYIEERLRDLSEKYLKSQKKTKGKSIEYENLVIKVKKITSRNKKLYSVNWHKDKEKGFDFKLNNEWYEREIKSAGKFIIITNVDDEPFEIFKTYKSLNTVESSFNCIKNQLEIRPINHYKEYRVKAHVFICILSLLVEKIIEKLITNKSAQIIIEELKRIKICNLNIDNENKKLITKLSTSQKEILEKLNINLI